MNNHQISFCFFLLLLAGFSPNLLQPVHAAEPTESAEKQDYTIIAGEWQRTDGSYLVTVSNVQTDGTATVAYFNPRPIHVEQGAITTQEGLVKLFIQLRDKGYEGSTYTLYYYAEKDALPASTIRRPWIERIKLFL